jgi:hypothetical protein
MHWILWALHFALVNAGKSMAARMAIMAITTNNSMSVKARFRSSDKQFIFQSLINYGYG